MSRKKQNEKPKTEETVETSQLDFEIRQVGDKFHLYGNDTFFMEGNSTDELKIRAEEIAKVSKSTFTVKVNELPKMDKRPERKYDMIGVNGKHEQLDVFKGLCKKNGWKIGEVVLKMIVQFNEQNK